MRIGLALTSFLLLLFGAAMIYAAGELGGSFTLGAPGPGRVPAACGWLIVGLAAAVMVRGLADRRAAPLAFPQWPRVLAMAVAGVAYVTVLPILGYYAATALFLFPVLLLLRASWLAAFGVTAGFVGFVYLIFVRLLNVPLP